MGDRLKVEQFFNTDNNEIKLTEEGLSGVNFLLGEYHGKKIREISGITRSAMVNYTNNPNGRISKRGRDGVESLANDYNSKQPTRGVVVDGLEQYSDKDLILELQRRGYRFSKET